MTGASQYLLAIYRTERRTSPPVAPGTVAESLGRSPSSTTEMLQRLDERGLVSREPYDGVTLTPEGRETAAELYETFVMLSRFFDEVLNLDAHEAEAMQLAGAVSQTVVDRLASTLLDGGDTNAPD